MCFKFPKHMAGPCKKPKKQQNVCETKSTVVQFCVKEIYCLKLNIQYIRRRGGIIHTFDPKYKGLTHK